MVAYSSWGTLGKERGKGETAEVGGRGDGDGGIGGRGLLKLGDFE